jgi:hypothetical protein
MRSVLSAFVVLAFPLALMAQSPVITPDGDPSVKPDTIYRLAIDPKTAPEEMRRYLLDDGVIRLEADGRGTTTYRQIIQILRPEGAEDYQEMQFSYAPKHEKLTINWLRVVKPDGTVISEKPTQVQESDVPAQMGDPIYSDRKVIRVSLSGVAAGTIVDFSTTTEELKPFLAGDALHSWSVSTGLAVARSRYIVDVPASVKLNIKEENLNFARKETVVGGRRVMTWAAQDLPKVKPEPFAADSNGVYMSVMWSLPLKWADIGKWYAGNSRGRYEVTPEVAAKMAELLRPARTLDDTLRAVHRWVAQDVRYVSIALGLGGYQPRTPAEVLSTGFGDCKDKATIFVAMLQKLGIMARPVLLNSTGGVERGLPSITQFDHAIAAYKRTRSSAWEYVDLTANLTPFGELPFGPQGEFGIIVHPDGAIEEVTFPLSEVEENRQSTLMVGTLREDGVFDGTYEESATGNLQYQIRQVFENPLDSTQKAQLANNVARGWFPGSDGSALEHTEGKDLSATPKVKLRITNGRAAQLAGSTILLRNLAGTMVAFADGARELDAQPPRRFPIDAIQIFGYRETSFELQLTLPAGYRATLPSGVEAASPFGVYRTTYRQDGDRLLVTRTVRGVRGVQPPNARDALTAWMRQVAKDDATVIVLEKAKD